MRKSMLLLCAAAGLAACGSKDDDANNAANAANTAANTATNAANAADTATSNAGGGYAPAQPGAGGGGQSVAVQFAGCTRLVKVSKPGGCLVVRAGSDTYDIESAQPRPNADSAIAGTGVYDPGTQSICMAGKPLTGVKWHYTKMFCPKSGDGEERAKKRRRG